MKKITFLLLSLSFSILNAQLGGFNYKALITNNDLPVSNQQISIRFTLLNDGNTIYQETHTQTTDANGIVTAIVGEGTPVFGDFTDIDWNNDIDLQVEVDTDNNGYVNLGTENLKFVPYAKYAAYAANGFSGNYNDLFNKPITFYAVGTTLPPTDISQDMYHLGGVIIGDYVNESERNVNPNTKLQVIYNANSPTDDIAAFTNTMNITSKSNTSYGFLNNVNYSGYGYGYGIANNVTFEGLGYSYLIGTINHVNGSGQVEATTGVFNEISTDSGGAIGMSSNITNNSDESSFAIDNAVFNNGTGEVIGIRNYLQGQTDVYGMDNLFESSTNAHHTGIINRFENTGTGDNVGVENDFTSGLGKQAGLVNFINNNEADFQAGTVSFFDNAANGYLYGHLVHINGSGDANAYAIADTISSSGNGNHYGLYNYMDGSGTGMKVGVWSTIDPNAGGQHYAIYGSAIKPGSFAGYFNGDVRISQKLLSNDSGDADTKAYVYGAVASNGTIISTNSSMGFQVSKLTDINGHYEITFDNPLLDSNQYIVVANRKMDDVNAPVLTTGIIQKNGNFEIVFRDYQGIGVDTDFSFVVYRK